MNDSTRRFWVNWALIAASGVACVAVVLTQTLWTSAEREVRASHLVVGFRVDDVERLELTHARKRAVVVREASVDAESQPDEPHDPHEHARFRVTEPFQGEAEEAAVDGLLRGVEFATVLRRVDETTFDRAAAGLDNPEQVIQLFMGDVEVRLRFGAEAKAPAGSRFVEVAGQGVANRGVYVVSQSTARDLMVTPDVFRIKQLVPYAASALRKVVLRGDSSQELVLSFDDAHKGWRVQQGDAQVRVSRLARERLFAAFARSELERVLDAGVVSQKTSTSVEVELLPRDSNLPRTKLSLGGKCPDAPDLELATRVEPDSVSGCTRALHLDTFLERPETLIDDGLLSLRTDEIEEVSITRGERVLELARRDSAWVMRRPQEGQVERDVGQAFVQALTALRGEVTAPPENPQMDVVVVVRTGGDTEPSVETQSFEVTLPTTAGVFVHRLDDDVWLRVAPSVTQQLVPFDLLLRKSDLTGFDPKELTRVSLTTADWHQSFAVIDQGKGCTLVAPAGFEAEPSACLDVIDALRTLRAQSWVAPSREGRFGLETPGASIEWTLQDNTAHRLTVGALAKGGGYYATLDSAGAVFTVSKKLVETLTTLVVSRAAFSIDPELLQSVDVKTPRRQVALVRLGDEFVSKREVPDSDSLEPAQIQALIDALSLLKAEAAVQLIGTSEHPTNVSNGSKQFDRPGLSTSQVLLEVTASQRIASGDLRTAHFKVGVGDVYRDLGVYYAEPVTREPHALFVLPRTLVARVLQAME